MKREILYRGWSIGEFTWEYGFLSWVDTPRGRGYFINNKRVDARTIGQYTGIDDREGEKIFEGDIFKIGAENNIYTVKFDYGCFLAYEDDVQVGILAELSTMFIKKIGNIHDNKELLK
jgi:hypothetical protein